MFGRYRPWLRMVLLGFTGLLAGLWAESSAADVSLRFGIYTSDKPTEMIRKFGTVLRALETSLEDRLKEPVQIDLKVAKTYDQGVADLVYGEVDFSRLGPASYVTAKRGNPGLLLLAMELTNQGKYFYGVICVREDSPIKSIEDLRGKTFAFGDQNSTIGRYLAQQYLAKHGVHAEDLSGYEYLGRHDKVGTLVALGRFDAGALKEGTYLRLVAKGEPLRVLARFRNVSKPWVVHPQVPERVRAALSQVLIEWKDTEALKALKKNGFTQTSDDEYEIVRQAMDASQDLGY